MSSPQDTAIALIDEAAAKGTSFQWQIESKDDLFNGLRDRIWSPYLIDQGSAGLCGPASILFRLATHDPVGYAQFVIELYEKGESRLGELSIQPRRRVRISRLPAGVHVSDWIPMASIRNSENWFFNYAQPQDQFAGISLPHEVVSWLKALGYRDIVNHTNLVRDVRWQRVVEANDYFSSNHFVLLFINGKMLYTKSMTRGSLLPNHWVVLTSNMNITTDAIDFMIYSWGDEWRRVPEQGETLLQKDFLDNFYGYIAATM